MKGKEFALKLPIEVNDKFNSNLFYNEIDIKEYYEREFTCFLDFLLSGFRWNNSMEGFYYWNNIYEKYL